MIELDGIKLCPYCFRVVGDSGICSCSYSRSNNTENALPAGSILNGRYVVGAQIEDTTDNGSTKKYLCYDYQEKQKVFIKEFYPKEYATRSSGTVIDVSNNGKMLEVYNNCMQKYISKVKNAQIIDCGYSLKVQKAFFENNTAYFVVDSHPLLNIKDFVAENDRISCEKAVRYLHQFMTFLGSADSHDIVHCGITDSTVYIDTEKDEIFIDGFESQYLESNFGSTRYFSLDRYMHVKSGASPVSKVCDYFSVGAVLYTLLTRKKPTSDIVCDDRFDLFAFEKIADKELRILIKKMCCIGGEEYGSFFELANDANSLFNKYGYSEIECFDSQVEELRSISNNRKKNKFIAAIVVAALAVIIAVGGFMLTKDKTDEISGEETTFSETIEDSSSEASDDTEKDKSDKEKQEGPNEENGEEDTTKKQKNKKKKE